MIDMNLKKRYQRRSPFLQRNWIASVNSFTNTDMGATLSNAKQADIASENDNRLTSPKKRRRVSSVDSLGHADDAFASPGSRPRNFRSLEVIKIYHKDSKKVREGHAVTIPRDLSTTRGHCRITIFDNTSNPPRPLFAYSEACRITTYKNPVGPYRVARIYIERAIVVPDHVLEINRSDDDNVRDLSDRYKLIVELEGATGSSWPPLDWQDFGISVSEPGPLFGTASNHWVLSSNYENIDGRLRNPLTISPGYSRPTRQTSYVMEVGLHSRLPQYRPPPEKGAKPCITAVDPEAEPYTNGHFEPVANGIVNGIKDIDAVHEVTDIDRVNTVNEGINDTNGGVVNASEQVNGTKANGVNETNGMNGVDEVNDVEISSHHADTSNELEYEMEGARTPTRALRTREKNKVYNLKVLSDQAQGKERKKRGRPAQVASSQGAVSYKFPFEQSVSVDYFRCVICGAFHSSMPQLQLHLQTFHIEWNYALETTSQGPMFRLMRKTLFEGDVSPPTFLLSKPSEPFNLPALISGDETWITSRLGLASVDEPTPASSPGGRSAHIRELFDRPQSRDSHNGADPLAHDTLTKTDTLTSNETLTSKDNLRNESQTKNGHNSLKPSNAKTRALPPRKEKILVPENKMQMFEPVSKRRLQHGEEVPNAPPDETWLFHKHQRILEDYQDIGFHEQNYMARWDAFILKKRLTGSSYFKRAWLEFVRQEAVWLVSNKKRMLEFAKHCSILFIRNVLEDSTMVEVFAIIDDARADVQNGVVRNVDDSGDESQHSLKGIQTRRGAGGCKVCQLPVAGPRLLLCSNKVIEPKSREDPGALLRGEFRIAIIDFTTRIALRKPGLSRYPSRSGYAIRALNPRRKRILRYRETRNGFVHAIVF